MIILEKIIKKTKKNHMENCSNKQYFKKNYKLNSQSAQY